MLHEYQIEKKLGEGGFGITYLAIDKHLDMQVAIKEYLPSDFAMRQSDVTVAPKSSALKEGFDWGLNSFIDEAKTIAQFDAPNIVKIHRFFKSNGTAYIVMEYCDGGSLSQRIKANPYSEQDTRVLLEELIKGLQVVHGNHIFHRDIKPDNIMFRKDNTPVLIDFGAARQSIVGQTRTVTSMVTPGYAPPEQYSQNTKFGPWTDIYALAAVAYNCLKGHKPSDAVQRMVDDDYQLLGHGSQTSGFLRGIDWGLQLSANKRPQDLASWIDSWDSGIVSDSVPSSSPSFLASGDDTVLQVPSGRHSSASQVTHKTTAAPEGGRLKFIILFIIALVLLGGGYYGYDYYQKDNVVLKPIPIPITQALEPSNVTSTSKVPDTGQLWITTTPSHAQITLLDIEPSYSAGMRLKFGRYGIKVKAAGYQEKIEFVNIGSGENNVLIKLEPQRVNIQKPPETGLLWITTTPSNAQVDILDIDPRYSAGMSLKLGRYRIKVQAAGYQQKIEYVDIRSGNNNASIKLQPQVVEIQKAPETGQLWIAITPSHGQVTLLDIEPSYSAGMKLKQGRYRVKLTAAGYQEKIETIEVGSGDNNVRVTLTRKALNVPLPKMVAITGGSFQMGSDIGESNEKPVHIVNIQSFRISQSEITFTQWDACVDAGGCSYKPHDEGWSRGNRPVINVSYTDITGEFIPWLNNITGNSYRLPSEAEWEYAARAGRTSRYSWGYTINCSQARYGYLSGECKKRQNTDRVKSFLANPFSLYDMHGNVWEWTMDCWNESYNAAPKNGEAWTKGDCSQRVLRGGSWLSRPDALRSAYRFRNSTTVRNNDLGFRLVQDR
jgi:formylglycine-generating enzyme required for sulfatase activity/serine/threonine protein kinase